MWLWAGNDSVIGGDAAAWWLGLSPDPAADGDHRLVAAQSAG